MLKIGDRICRVQDEIWEGVEGEIVSVHAMGYDIKLIKSSDTVFWFFNNCLLKDIYHSPLYKVMKENET